VVLFGSRARGDHLEDSDIDVLVVADGLPRDPREAYELLYDPSEPLLSPIGMNTSVFLRRLREGSTFILEVLEDGRILCGDKSFIEEVLKLYREKRRQYIRRGKAWVKVS
jgi:predicted nucleotidyltransferase